MTRTSLIVALISRLLNAPTPISQTNCIVQSEMSAILVLGEQTLQLHLGSFRHDWGCRAAAEKMTRLESGQARHAANDRGLPSSTLITYIVYLTPMLFPDLLLAAKGVSAAMEMGSSLSSVALVNPHENSLPYAFNTKFLKQNSLRRLFDDLYQLQSDSQDPALISRQRAKIVSSIEDPEGFETLINLFVNIVAESRDGPSGLKRPSYRLIPSILEYLSGVALGREGHWQVYETRLTDDPVIDSLKGLTPRWAQMKYHTALHNALILVVEQGSTIISLHDRWTSVNNAIYLLGDLRVAESIKGLQESLQLWKAYKPKNYSVEEFSRKPLGEAIRSRIELTKTAIKHIAQASRRSSDQEVPSISPPPVATLSGGPAVITGYADIQSPPDLQKIYDNQPFDPELAKKFAAIIHATSRELLKSSQSKTPLSSISPSDAISAFEAGLIRPTGQKGQPGTIRAAHENAGGSAAVVFWVVENIGLGQFNSFFRLFINPVIVEASLDWPEMGVAMAAKEGSIIVALGKNPSLYAGFDDEIGKFNSQPFDINNPNLRELAKHASAKIIQLEDFGYSTVVDLFAGKPIPSENVKPSTRLKLAGVANRFERVIFVANEKQSELNRKVDIVNIELKENYPMLYAAIKLIESREGLGFLVDVSYLQPLRPRIIPLASTEYGTQPTFPRHHNLRAAA
jgi:hypothetical protein